MNWIDISILSIIGLSVIIGIFRGFIREVLSLVNLGVAIFASKYFHDVAQGYLQNFIDSTSIRSVVAFVVVFVIFIVIGSVLTHFIGFLVKKSGLGGTDKFLGLLFGFVRGSLVCAIILAGVSFSSFKTQPSWQKASLIPVFSPLIEWFNNNLSEKVTTAFREPSLQKNLIKGAASWQQEALKEQQEFDTN